MFRWVVVAIAAMLAFSQAYAFESPSGYQEAVYTVDWSYSFEPLVGKVGTPASVSAKTTDNLTVSNSLVLPYKVYTSGGYITYTSCKSVSPKPTTPQRGYTKVLNS